MKDQRQREKRQRPASATTCIGVALACLLGACSDVPLTPLVDGGVEPDASAPADARSIPTPEPPAPPVPPAAPAPASLTPCPDGWREVAPATPEDVATCDPWPVGGPAECDDDEAHFPGDPDCTVIGTPCTSGDWPQDLPIGGDKLYVRPGGGGNGTMSAPFATIGAALAAAQEGTVIVLGKGVYNEAVTVRTGVTLWGACVAETVVSPSVPSAAVGAINIESSNATLRNLQISGNRIGVLLIGANYSVELQGVLIAQAQRFGMYINQGLATASSLVIRGTRSSDSNTGEGMVVNHGARVMLTRAVLRANRTLGIIAYGVNTELNLTDTAIRDTLPNLVGNHLGDGLDVSDSAHVRGERLIIEGNRERGVDIYAGATGEFTDLVVRDTLSSLAPGYFGELGEGVAVRDGATVSIARGLIMQNRNAGIFAVDPDSHIDVEDSVVAGNHVAEGGSLAGEMGIGLGVGFGASATVRRVLVADNHDSNILIGGSGATAVLEDVTAHRGRPRTRDLRYGVGISVGLGARATVERALFAHNRHAGVIATGDGSELLLMDARVSGTRYQESDLQYGEGMRADGSAQVILQRVVFEDNDYAGIFAYDIGTHLDMTDVVVRGTNPSFLDGSMGIGLFMLPRATGELTRGLIEDSHTAGIVVAGQNSHLQVADVTVRGTRPRAADGDLGRGLHVSGGGSVAGQRVVLEDNHDIGVMVLNDGSSVMLDDVVVRRTEARELDGNIGYGVGAYRSGFMSLRRFSIADNERLGLQITTGGQIKLYDGSITGHIIAANVQDPDFDLACLQDNAEYTDNEIQWRGYALPVPGTGL